MRDGGASAVGGGAGPAHHRRPATPPIEPVVPSFVGHSLDVIANRAHPPTGLVRPRASGRAAGSTRRRRFGYHALAIDEQRRDFEPCPWDEADAAEGQTIEQVWFAGVHSDVGGWYDERGLSNVALHWMLGKAGDCGLRVDRAGLASRRPDPHGTMHQSWAGIWKTRPCRTRKVSEGARVHRSVFERRDGGRVRYDPKNLPANPTVVD